MSEPDFSEPDFALDDEDVLEAEDDDALGSLLFDPESEVVSDDLAPSDVFSGVFSAVPRPLLEADDADRESVMYQPLPLKTMPTG